MLFKKKMIYTLFKYEKVELATEALEEERDNDDGIDDIVFYEE